MDNLTLNVRKRVVAGVFLIAAITLSIEKPLHELFEHRHSHLTHSQNTRETIVGTAHFSGLFNATNIACRKCQLLTLLYKCLHIFTVSGFIVFLVANKPIGLVLGTFPPKQIVFRRILPRAPPSLSHQVID